MNDDEALPPQSFSAAPGEVEALLGALHRNRRTFAWKTGGLDAEAMRRTLGPSTMTLGGLVKHVALVEDHYFTHQLLGRAYPDVWGPMTDDDGWDWASASADSPAELRSLWLEAVARSQAAGEVEGRAQRVLVDVEVASGQNKVPDVRGKSNPEAASILERLLATSEWSETPNLRRVLVDMIEEYARHTGHADLIRESIDGLVGEDAPR